ncbi:MAG: alkaline phosphatase D family protein [Halioglobus sp.]|nr:alkaline phosphatase D family protein [Halioglobus sp.]
MPPSRRTFLKGLGAVTLVPALSNCSDSSDSQPPEQAAALPPRPVPSENFDYPIVTELPFAHGVASGDPLKDRVIIWTRVTEEDAAGDAVPVTWQVATDPGMRNVVAQGTQDAISEHDWTIKVDVVGLSPATSYYYQFSALGGLTSIVGRTRTAPEVDVSAVRIAVVSCSSYWSSYWSGYGHLADRNDIDLVAHCGDYIYEFVDEDETVRARRDIDDINYVDYRDWLNLDEVRRRYALYRSDPNLLRAHQQHPWAIVWDNHDISVNFGNELDDSSVDDSQQTTTLADTVRAFYEWTPTRPVRADGSGEFVLVEDGSYPEPADPLQIYRKLDYGPMADIFCVDTQLYLPSRERPGVVSDSSHLASGDSLFSRKQYEWLTEGMAASQQQGKRWRLLVNQTWITSDLTRWADYPEERQQFFEFLRGDNSAAQRLHNNIVVSGDMHGNWGSDLVEKGLSGYRSGDVTANTQNGSTAENAAAGYYRGSTANTVTDNARAASVGVEFAPTSMGRGGFDEIVANNLPDSTTAQRVAASRNAEKGIINSSPACQFVEWVDHGYGIVHLTSESATFEYWWQDKLTPGSPDVLGNQMIAFAADDPAQTPPRYRDQLDHVSLHGMPIAATAGARVAEPAPSGVLDPR